MYEVFGLRVEEMMVTGDRLKAAVGGGGIYTGERES